MHPVVMTFTATVENGKVVLPPEVKLPSGTKVRVETLDGALTEAPIGAKLQALQMTTRREGLEFHGRVVC